MSNTDDTTDEARNFVRELFGRTSRLEITDQGLSADDLNTLFNTDD